MKNKKFLEDMAEMRKSHAKDHQKHLEEEQIRSLDYYNKLETRRYFKNLDKERNAIIRVAMHTKNQILK